MRSRILDILKDTDEYTSGEDMSRRLGISRAAVCKHIKKLRDEGYGILSVTNRGYKLTGLPDDISAAAVKSMLNTEFIARNIVYSETVGSTNDEAKKYSDCADGTLFTAERQSSGKGRTGKSWESPAGSGIWMSLLLKPRLAPEEVSSLTLAAGIAVCRAIGGSAAIKWPNDIVIGTRKVCGILTEMSAEPERVSYVVCGIGINVNTESFPEELKDKATSLYIQTGRRHHRAALIAAVMNEFEPLYKQFQQEGIAPLIEEYKKVCVTLNRDVRVICRNGTVTGRAVDIDENGALEVMTETGRISVTAGEVSVRGLYGYV